MQYSQNFLNLIIISTIVLILIKSENRILRFIFKNDKIKIKYRERNAKKKKISRQKKNFIKYYGLISSEMISEQFR